MKAFEIINSTLDDLDFACYLFEEAIKYQKRKNYPQYRSADRPLLEQDIKRGEHFKLLIEQEIAGIFSICFSDELVWREKNKEPAIYLHRIVVNPKYKGQKILAKILHWASEKATAMNIALLRLDTWDHNPDLKHYYESLGFQLIENYTLPDIEELPFNARGNEVILMQLGLNNQNKQLFYSPSKLVQLILQFEHQTLPKEEWTHAAHLQVAIWYSSRLNGKALFRKVKTGIIKYNEAVGTPNTTSEGYHETITRFWLWSAPLFLKNHPFDSVETAAQAYLNSPFAQRDFPLRFYTRDRLFSVEARLHWVEPDLKSLDPVIVASGEPINAQYMIIEHFHQGKVRQLYERFDQKGRLLPEGVNYIDSWIDERVEVCYQLMESKSRAALEEWIRHWQDLADFEIIPILSSAAAKAKVLGTSK